MKKKILGAILVLSSLQASHCGGNDDGDAKGSIQMGPGPVMPHPIFKKVPGPTGMQKTAVLATVTDVIKKNIESLSEAEVKGVINSVKARSKGAMGIVHMNEGQSAIYKALVDGFTKLNQDPDQAQNFLQSAFALLLFFHSQHNLDKMITENKDKLDADQLRGLTNALTARKKGVLGLPRMSSNQLDLYQAIKKAFDAIKQYNPQTGSQLIDWAIEKLK